jgi:hypothetical protein
VWEHVGTPSRSHEKLSSCVVRLSRTSAASSARREVTTPHHFLCPCGILACTVEWMSEVLPYYTMRYPAVSPCPTVLALAAHASGITFSRTILAISRQCVLCWPSGWCVYRPSRCWHGALLLRLRRYSDSHLSAWCCPLWYYDLYRTPIWKSYR